MSIRGFGEFDFQICISLNYCGMKANQNCFVNFYYINRYQPPFIFSTLLELGCFASPVGRDDF